MISLFINCSLIGLALIALLKNNQDKLSIFSFVSIWAIFGLFSSKIGYPQYYIAGAVADLVIVQFLSKIASPTITAITLIEVSLTSILLNLFGFLCYFAEISHTYYDSSYIPLLLITVFTVNKRDKNNGSLANNIRFVYFLSYYFEGFGQIPNHKKAART